MVSEERDEGVRGAALCVFEDRVFPGFGFVLSSPLSGEVCPWSASELPLFNLDGVGLHSGVKASAVRRSGSHSTIRSDRVSKRFCVKDFGSFKGCSAA